jgi:hypothetical protein
MPGETEENHDQCVRIGLSSNADESVTGYLQNRKESLTITPQCSEYNRLTASDG